MTKIVQSAAASALMLLSMQEAWANASTELPARLPDGRQTLVKCDLAPEEGTISSFPIAYLESFDPDVTMPLPNFSDSPWAAEMMRQYQQYREELAQLPESQRRERILEHLQTHGVDRNYISQTTAFCHEMNNS